MSVRVLLAVLGVATGFLTWFLLLEKLSLQDSPRIHLVQFGGNRFFNIHFLVQQKVPFVYNGTYKKGSTEFSTRTYVFVGQMLLYRILIVPYEWLHVPTWSVPRWSLPFFYDTECTPQYLVHVS